MSSEELTNKYRTWIEIDKQAIVKNYLMFRKCLNEVNVGDEVVLIGTSGEERVSAEELASVAETVNYEIITCINSRVNGHMSRNSKVKI